MHTALVSLNRLQNQKVVNGAGGGGSMIVRRQMSGAPGASKKIEYECGRNVFCPCETLPKLN